MLAVYPGLEADVATQARLLGAYVRRKQFEARLIALEVGKLFGSSTEPERVSEEQILSLMGITPVVADGN